MLIGCQVFSPQKKSSEQVFKRRLGLLVTGLDVTPDVLGRGMAGGLHSELDAVSGSDFAKEGMPQRMGGEAYLLVFAALDVGLGGQTAQQPVYVLAAQPLSGAGQKQRPDAIAAFVQIGVESLLGFPGQKNLGAAELALAFHVDEMLTAILVTIQRH